MLYLVRRNRFPQDGHSIIYVGPALDFRFDVPVLFVVLLKVFVPVAFLGAGCAIIVPVSETSIL